MSSPNPTPSEAVAPADAKDALKLKLKKVLRALSAPLKMQLGILASMYAKHAHLRLDSELQVFDAFLRKFFPTFMDAETEIPADLLEKQLAELGIQHGAWHVAVSCLCVGATPLPSRTALASPLPAVVTGVAVVAVVVWVQARQPVARRAVRSGRQRRRARPVRRPRSVLRWREPPRSPAHHPFRRLCPGWGPWTPCQRAAAQ